MSVVLDCIKYDPLHTRYLIVDICICVVHHPPHTWVTILHLSSLMTSLHYIPLALKFPGRVNWGVIVGLPPCSSGHLAWPSVQDSPTATESIHYMQRKGAAEVRIVGTVWMITLQIRSRATWTYGLSTCHMNIEVVHVLGLLFKYSFDM